MTSAPPIGFEYRGSAWLLTALLLMAMLAILAVWASALTWYWALALSLVTVAGVGWQSLRILRPRVHSLLWLPDGSVRLTLAEQDGFAHREVMASMQTGHVLGPVISLGLRWHGGQEKLWLLPDNLDKNLRRKLRVRLGADPAVQRSSHGL